MNIQLLYGIVGIIVIVLLAGLVGHIILGTPDPVVDGVLFLKFALGGVVMGLIIIVVSTVGPVLADFTLALGELIEEWVDRIKERINKNE